MKKSFEIKNSTYTGLYRFHKYWGKKPLEVNELLISKLTKKDEIIYDPFMGGGLISRTVLTNNRKFIGTDINPISKDLAELFVNLPKYENFKFYYKDIEKKIKNRINESYTYKNNIASHYLWNEKKIKEVWYKEEKKIKRVNIKSKDSEEKLTSFIKYNSKLIRKIKFFDNSRINSKKGLKLNDLFTGRALRNIDLLISEINSIKDPIIKKSLLLNLTSASGQMSNMVFSISKRKKKDQVSSDKEVGSWAIGLWRPKEHFEINVWNCFRNKVENFIKVLRNNEINNKIKVTDNINKFFSTKIPACIMNNSCLDVLKKIPKNKIQLILTDPPHSDRIPYLELSEFWNAILQYKQPDFSKEIVVSNAKDRDKKMTNYNKDMTSFYDLSFEVLKKNGFLVLFFNADNKESWSAIKNIKKFKFIGCFPMNYSANSIVQDNRKGSMKSDYVLIYSKSKDSKITNIKNIKGFSNSLPNLHK